MLCIEKWSDANRLLVFSNTLHIVQMVTIFMAGVQANCYRNVPYPYLVETS